MRGIKRKRKIGVKRGERETCEGDRWTREGGRRGRFKESEGERGGGGSELGREGEREVEIKRNK